MYDKFQTTFHFPQVDSFVLIGITKNAVEYGGITTYDTSSITTGSNGGKLPSLSTFNTI